ncbi:MAG: alpha/beta hydrolase, partial [Chloroflexota bacterium]
AYNRRIDRYSLIAISSVACILRTIRPNYKPSEYLSMRRLYALLLLLMLVGTSVSAQSTSTDDEVIVLRDIPYVTDGAPRQELDIHLPPGADTTFNFAQPYPTIFMVHGGGFVFGSRRLMVGVAERYAQEGYAVIAPSYRLAPEHVYPAAFEDVYCALAWTLANADDYGFDTNEFIMLGESAGANATLLITLAQDSNFFAGNCAHQIPADFDIRAVIAVYPPVELSTCDCEFARSMGSTFLDVDIALWDEPDGVYNNFREGSLLYWLEDENRLADLPPVYLEHGTADSVVPISESELFVDAYTAVGGDITLFAVEGADHAYFTRARTDIAQTAFLRVDAWLNEVLSP